MSFLCLRRGVSLHERRSRCPVPFSLPTQRCFLFTRKVNERRRLFSAYAEVFLPRAQKRPVPHPFLCLRRGVSQARIQRQLTPQLFSAYAEVFPSSPRSLAHTTTFLCLRRGVSSVCFVCLILGGFSLPTQRCFLLRNPWVVVHELFSAYAEVFLTSRNPLSRWTHFSLPTQRCFSLEISPPVLCRLFSAYAEVFLLRA